MVSYRTPLGRARGLGSAKHGAVDWLSERFAAIALVPLCLWAAFGVLRIATLDYLGAVQWVAHPLNATLLVLTVAISFWHMHRGMRVVVEDYIHVRLSKLALLLLNFLVCGLAGSLAVFSILKVAFGGGEF
jgi:succinate dehydrogenase / fumarate reductase membrane anchor subunit